MQSSPRPVRGVFRKVTIVAVAALGMLLGACTANQSAVPDPLATAEAYSAQIVADTPDTPVVDLGAVAGDPEAYLGQQVTVRGQVRDIIYEGGFFMEEGIVRGFGDEIVVLYTADTNGITLHDGELVQVTGTVQRFDRIDLERNFVLDLSDDFYRDLEDRVTIVADAVRAPL